MKHQDNAREIENLIREYRSMKKELVNLASRPSHPLNQNSKDRKILTEIYNKLIKDMPDSYKKLSNFLILKNIRLNEPLRKVRYIGNNTIYPDYSFADFDKERFSEYEGNSQFKVPLLEIAGSILKEIINIDEKIRYDILTQDNTQLQNYLVHELSKFFISKSRVNWNSVLEELVKFKDIRDELAINGLDPENKANYLGKLKQRNNTWKRVSGSPR